MAAAEQGQDRILKTDLTESLGNLSIDTEEKASGAEKLKEQTLAPNDERTAPSSVSHDPKIGGPSSNIPGQSGAIDASRDGNAAYPPNVYAPQAHPFYYAGYENTTNQWDEYPQYINAERIDLASPGLYNENPSVVFHSGYGYNPQIPYGPYSPVTTPMPSVRGDGQMYSPQQFPYTGPYYQQPVPPNMAYVNSQTMVSQPELSAPAGVDPQGFDLFGSGPWTDWSKSPDGHRSLGSLPAPAVSPQPLTAMGSFANNLPVAAGVGSQQQRPLYGFGSTTNSYGRSYQHGGMYQGTGFGGSNSGLAMSGRSWTSTDKGRRRGRGSGSLCSCNGALDVLNEQNRGPRASRSKAPVQARNPSADGKVIESTTINEQSELYNRSDFATEYKEAKFFIIKSYSEDNVHKSIKYGVWASTANGNRRLDTAYREAKEKDPSCPVFLFFSVNASAHFCGVAEMMGPVDFDKSVDYWQQDKWSGQFPVKWHIIKDIPNNQFRHIILENNDNKPVTNSRDTQEVKLEQGLEILKIFKNHESDQSILQDFNYYEEREMIMQKRKARLRLQESGFEDQLEEKKSPRAALLTNPNDVPTKSG